MKRSAEHIGYALGLPILLIAIWWISSLASTTPFFPAPDVLGRGFYDLWFSSPAFLEHGVPTITNLLLGLAIAIIVGIGLGIVIGMLPWLRRLTEPILEFFRAMPPVVMIPVFMLIVGINNSMQIMVILFGCIWPVLLNTVEGVRSVNAVLLETAQSYQLKGQNRLRHVIIPHALPQIMAGVRITVALALIMTVVSEMFASSTGVGHMIIMSQRTFAISQMWAGILLLGILGILITVGLRFVEGRLLNWYHGQKEAEHAD